MARWTLRQLTKHLERKGVIGQRTAVDTSDRPFGCPIDTILDIPVPPSVNRTRKVNRAALRNLEDWRCRADARIMANGQFRTATRHKVGKTFEAQLILNPDKCNCDLDNVVKSAIDYLKRIELIEDDSPQHMRRLVVEWGAAPEGCRIVLRAAA